MVENPYESPPIDAEAVGVRSGRREDLRSVALYQKGILICILVYLTAIASQFVLPPELRLVIAAGVITAGLAGTVFVFLLAMKVYTTGVGILLGILTLMPCIGLIVLLIINGKATGILQRNGIRVGLLGANLSEIY